MVGKDLDSLSGRGYLGIVMGPRGGVQILSWSMSKDALCLVDTELVKQLVGNNQPINASRAIVEGRDVDAPF